MAKRGPKARDGSKSTPLPGIPSPPDYLDDAALAHWREITSEIAHAGILSQLDRDALIIYITTWSRWHRAEAELAKTGKGQGVIVKARNGYLQPNPWLKVAKDCLRTMTVYIDMFGLSPKSRDRLTFPEPPKSASHWEDLDTP